MQRSDDRHERLRFGVFEADIRSGELTQRGRRCRIQEQPFRVLAILLERPGEVVSREELQKKLWPDTTVDFDHGLNKAVSKIREVLGDSADSPRFIETVARRGYRFLGDVEIVWKDDGAPGQEVVVPGGISTAVAEASSSTEASAPAEACVPPPASVRRQTRPTRRLLFGGVIGFVLALALTSAVAWMGHQRTRAPDEIVSLAVLPLKNLSNDASQDYFADGMTDELITRLSQISDLRVISRTSAMTYKNSQKTLREIARELNVDAVVEGAVLKSGQQVRISTQLIDAFDDKELFAQSYNGELPDALGLQSRIAGDVATQIRSTLKPTEKAAIGSSRHVQPEAYDAYLKGRYFLNKRSEDGLRKAIAYFIRSSDVDPLFAQAFAGLADAYALSGDWKYGILPPTDAFAKAKAAAAKALALDASLGEAHASLAFALDLYAWNWSEAEKEYKRAIELNPGYATTYEWYSWHLIMMGQTDEALAALSRAVNLDPLSLIISADVADDLSVARRFDEAERQSMLTLELDPNFAVGHFELGQALVQKDNYPAAIAEFQKAIALSGPSGAFEANLGYAYAKSGRANDAMTIVKNLQSRTELDHSAGADVALIYVGLGNHDEAISWLNKAFDARFKASMLRHPVFDSIRNDARFKDLMLRVGLPE